MPYILSSENRFYTKVENSYGHVPPISTANRIPAVKLAMRQQLEVPERRDKTGSRTFAGFQVGGRRRTSYELRTYLTNWAEGQEAPGYGPLFQASLGGAPLVFGGGTAASGSSGATLVFSGAHGLVAGQAVTHEGEMRFVSSVVDTRAVQLNAPFSDGPTPGSFIGGTIVYTPATEIPSVSIYDYWSPETAVQRILCGAAVSRMTIRVNGDYHEFEFSGVAQELIDSSSFSGNIGELSNFPEEPSVGDFDYSIVPGHMGQAWLGATSERFFTITSATFLLDNNLDFRTREFGSSFPLGVSPGRRSVSIDFDLFGQDDSATKGLYQASRQRSPIEVMFQLGERSGQLMGVYLKSVVPEVPEYDDSESRMLWRFRESRAQGTLDDEIAIAFG